MLIKFVLAMSRSLGIGALAICLACETDHIVSVPWEGIGRTIAVSVGQELRITLGNVGPAQYESPPQISSAAIMFVDVQVVSPFTPAGPTQQFRFLAVSPGQAVIRFRRLLGDTVVSFVEDTVRIR